MVFLTCNIFVPRTRCISWLLCHVDVLLLEYNNKYETLSNCKCITAALTYASLIPRLASVMYLAALLLTSVPSMRQQLPSCPRTPAYLPTCPLPPPPPIHTILMHNASTNFIMPLTSSAHPHYPHRIPVFYQSLISHCALQSHSIHHLYLFLSGVWSFQIT